MTVLCLCQEDNHRKLIPGYARAFRERGIQFLCVDWAPPFACSLEQILQRCPQRPSYIFHFESDFPLLPEGLTRSEIPTVCFQVDTYTFTKRRMHWSSVFDHAAVFHPGYETLFQQHGHPGAFLLPHAVRRDWFDGPPLLREFEVAWVGQTRGALYGRRQEWIPRLASTFRMNDWKRSYSLQEVAEVYRRSDVVVNIGRDDFPQDANLRVFEALASGAVLVTSLPSELTDLGFEEGVHFIGYRQDSDMMDVVRRLLNDERRRLHIAQAGRSKVLHEHTYDSRVDKLLERLHNFGQEKLAPARDWSEPRVRLVYLDFFAGSGMLDCAAAQFWRLAGHGFRETIEEAGLLGKAWMEHLRAHRKSAA
jgi:glycosyltransferase involved in cell wall biosynthesis